MTANYNEFSKNFLFGVKKGDGRNLDRIRPSLHERFHHFMNTVGVNVTDVFFCPGHGVPAEGAALPTFAQLIGEFVAADGLDVDVHIRWCGIPKFPSRLRRISVTAPLTEIRLRCRRPFLT